MIGAHNTFTYLNAKDLLINIFKPFWKCQTYDIDALYTKYGVRFFDIRLCENTTGSLIGLIGKLFKKKKFTWATTHGIAKFNKTFDNFEELLKYMKDNFPEAQYRVILENCSTKAVSNFNSQIESWIENDGNNLKSNDYRCSWIGIKKPWTEVYVNENLYPEVIEDYCCRLFNWDYDKSLIWNIKNFKISYTIKNWAKNNNPLLTTNQKEDPSTLYFMDFVGRY